MTDTIAWEARPCSVDALDRGYRDAISARQLAGVAQTGGSPTTRTTRLRPVDDDWPALARRDGRT